MNVGQAIHMMQMGHRVARAGWDGGSFLYLVPAAAYPAQRGAAKRWAGEDAMVEYKEYIAQKPKWGGVSNWVPTHADLLAKDWVSIEDDAVEPCLSNAVGERV